VPDTAVGPAADRRSDHLLTIGTLVLALALPLSIAASQIALAIAALGWLGRRCPLPSRSIVAPAALFAVLTLASAIASERPLVGIIDAKDLLLLTILAIVPAALTIAAGQRRRMLTIWLAASGVAAIWGLVEYLGGPGGIEHRARGPFGHYMAYAGVLMLASISCAAPLLQRGRERRRPVLFLLLFVLLAALGATYARNAWLGVAVGLATTALALRPRAAPLALIVPLVALAALPSLRSRALSALDLEANRDRLEMLEVGRAMVRAHPLVGVGPNHVRWHYESFGGTRPQPHLHNNWVQLAAERGLPCALAWTWLMAALALATIRNARLDPRPAHGAAALGALAAVIVGGLFEYNFGDSEVEMSLLFIVSLAISRRPDPTSSS